MLVPRSLRYRLSPGDRLYVLGGYEEPPAWLGGKDRVVGTVRRADEGGLAVVELDAELAVTLARDDGELRATGRYLLLSPRFRQRWWQPGWSRVVHVELHEPEPDLKDLGSGAWIESHAHYRILPRS